MADYTINTKAIVTTPSKDGKLNWNMHNVKLRNPHEDEVLVRVVAVGICHTDIVMSHIPSEYGLYPKVLGHEGAGVVEKVGSKITHVKPGDYVVLSFDSCENSSCYNCKNGHPSYCTAFTAKNVMAVPGVYKLEDGQAAAGSYFGQSSFSEFALVQEKSAVNVSDLIKSEEELKLFAPFGCGFQTGAGAVTETADVQAGDEIAVFGLGGVGMLAVMAARIRGCRTIIGVDRVQSRLDIAKSVGATHVINTSGFENLEDDVAAAIRSICPAGTNCNVDTTGVLGIVQVGLAALQPKGQLVLIGIMRGLTLPIDLGTFLATGVSIRACIEGSALPKKYIPQMIEWYRDGKLPIEKIIKQYAAEDFEAALEEMHTGAVIKPVLIW
ncbi:chaperonin 10-like protein [Clohesyomyces aquaticus]|uniref:Chaperonin 10-like protein n=1 Tax=Clohesyomyces aquaticus TaxID=1231657 RepID=A0A1Y1ZJH1_9PLEO|nr:chaperonin 10-like protein [Clohesyomyces aquaticus]